MKGRRTQLREVGFWRGKAFLEDWGYPKVEDAVDLSWSAVERQAVLSYVRRGSRWTQYGQSWCGWSDCRICGMQNGTIDLTDGVYVWPEGFAHYIEKHGVKPPLEFVEHVLDRIAVG